MSISRFLACGRVEIHKGAAARRRVYLSRIVRSVEEHSLEKYIADCAPLFYRSPDKIVETLEEGYFLTAFREVVRRLPTSSHFRDSHFGEILAAVFAREVVGWRLIYSKLRMTTAENSNPYKMDLVFFDPSRTVPTIILGEVKSSMKSGIPARHDKSCYPSLFDSLREYSIVDLEYDLTAARDSVEQLPLNEQEKVKKALLPYAEREIVYAGFSVIDTDTRRDSETSMLAKRKSSKTFDIDLVCVDDLSDVSESTYKILDAMHNV